MKFFPKENMLAEDDDPGSSKVVMLRGIPTNCKESELEDLATRFGNVSKKLIVSHKRIAFIEMESIETASSMLQHYNSEPLYINEERIFMQFSKRKEITLNSRYASNSSDQVIHSRSAKLDGKPNRILLVTISNMRYPVTIENLHSVFCRFGEVLRIKTFKKKYFQAFIEFSNLSDATTAKVQLEDRDMFQQCCTLLISYSRQKPPLKIAVNNLLGRDFTLQNQIMAPSNIFAQPTFSHQQAAFPISLPFIVPQTRFTDNILSVQHPYQQQLSAVDEHGTVLLVHNLNQEKVNPDVLFTIFGVYGDVIRVKILYKKRHTALVQFVTATQSSRAQRFLDKSMLYGSEISIIPSKHASITLPTNLPSDSEEILWKEYSDSPLHRFKIPNSRNEQHISSPSSTLHLSCLPKDISKEELKDIFIDEEGEAIGIKIFGKDRNRPMAMVKFDSIEIATCYLIRYHNHSLRDKFMKINFSSWRQNNT